MARNTFAYAGSAGERLISVSEVLALAGLSADFSYVRADVLEHARERGSDVHAWVEGIAKGFIGDEQPDAELAPYVSAFRAFVREAPGTFIGSEVRVVSKVYGFAGTLDLLYALPPSSHLAGAWLLDVKARESVGPEARLQTAGYGIGLRESPEAKLEPRRWRRGVLQLSREERWRLIPHANDREDEHDFLAALRVAQFRLRNNLARIEG